jgi:hypothetical protein
MRQISRLIQSKKKEVHVCAWKYKFACVPGHSYTSTGIDGENNAWQYVDDSEEVFDGLGAHDLVIVTAVPHSMDATLGFKMPPFTVFA